LLSLLPADPGRPLRILCLGAHADDIEIGAAGTLAALLAARPGTRVRWAVFSAGPERAEEARAAAERVLAGAGSSRMDVLGFPDGRFPTEMPALKDAVEAMARDERPDIVLTHRLADAHQDHRALAEAARNTFRDHLLLEYEIPKYDGDLGNPSLFVPLDRSAAEAKARLVWECFPSQRRRAWFTPDTFLALMRLRGVQCASPGGYAEAFDVPKLSLGLAPS
jgi:LmbE family N-acetylglucosaminyl deacetylase